MAYNPYASVKAIYDFKGMWDDADKNGDTEAKKKAAEGAKKYYEDLRSNGYGNIADELNASDYGNSKAIKDKWAKMGRTSTRDYLYSLGKSFGMTQSDVDNLISWDSTTGEVSFGGKKIGTPDAVVDGVSYWSDTSALDNAFTDYIDRSGTTRSKSSVVDQENEKLFKLYGKEYEDLKNENPFETEVGKSILAKYDLAGLQGRDNAVASNAGANGGNIDSFAAANALRQQASLVSQGQSAALSAHQQKLDHARQLLSDMGVHIDRVFNQNETEKNNDVARKSEIAAVSGYTPTEWSIQNDPFLKSFVDENGALKPEYYDVDFQKLINTAKANGNTDLAEKYAILRGLKITGNFEKYGKYLEEGDVSYFKPERTGDYDLNKQSIDSNERIAKDTNAASLNATNAKLESNEKIAGIEAQNNLDVIKTTAEYKNGVPYSKSSSGGTVPKVPGTSSGGTVPKVQGTSGNSGNSGNNVYNSGNTVSEGTYNEGWKPSLTSAQAAQAIKQGQITPETIACYNYYYGTNFTVDNPPVSPRNTNYKTNQSNSNEVVIDNTSSNNPPAKPTLTAAQATNAIKSGELSQTVVDAYNYYYGTNYTVDNPPTIYKNGTSGENVDLLGDTVETDESEVISENINNVYDQSSSSVKDFIRNELEPLITDNNVTESYLKNFLIGNSAAYDLEVNDIKAICKALGVDAKWVDDYKNAGLFGWGSGVVSRKDSKK